MLLQSKKNFSPPGLQASQIFGNHALLDVATACWFMLSLKRVFDEMKVAAFENRYVKALRQNQKWLSSQEFGIGHWLCTRHAQLLLKPKLVHEVEFRILDCTQPLFSRLMWNSCNQNFARSSTSACHVSLRR